MISARSAFRLQDFKACTYKVAVLKSQEFCEALVFVHTVEILGYAFAIYGGLCQLSLESVWNLGTSCHTSAVHFPAAAANLSIGLVFPGILSSP